MSDTKENWALFDDTANFTSEQIQSLNTAATALQAVAKAASQKESVTTQVEVFNLHLARLKQILNITEDSDAYMAILAHSHALRLAPLLNSNDDDLGCIKRLIGSAGDKLKAQRAERVKTVYENIKAAIADAPLPAGDGPYSDYFLGIEGAEKTEEDITPTLDELCRANLFPGEGIVHKENEEIKIIRAEHPLITQYAKSYNDLGAILKVLGKPDTQLDIWALMGTDFELNSLERHYSRCAGRTSPDVMGCILTGLGCSWAMEKEREQNHKPLKESLLGSETANEFFAVIKQSSDEEKKDFGSAQRLYVMEELIKRSNKIEEMRILLENGLCEVNYQHQRTLQSALHFAIEHNNVAAIAFLIGKNANISTKNRSGKTPLMLAFEPERDPGILLGAVLDGLAHRLDAKNNKKAKYGIRALRERINNGAINIDNVENEFSVLIDRLKLNNRSFSLNDVGLFSNKFVPGKRKRTVSADNSIYPNKINETSEQIREKLILLTEERLKSIQFPVEGSTDVLVTKKDLVGKIGKFNQYSEALSILKDEQFYRAKFKTQNSSVIHSTSYLTNMGESLKDMKIEDRLNLASSLINQATFPEQISKNQNKIVSKTKELFWKIVETLLGRKLENKFPRVLTSKDTLFREAFNELWPRPKVQNQAQPKLSEQSPEIKRSKSDRPTEVEAATKCGMFGSQQGDLNKDTGEVIPSRNVFEY